MRFEYEPGATPIDPDEAKGLIPAHLTLQRELNESHVEVDHPPAYWRLRRHQDSIALSAGS
jgi:hypothetical protein